MLCGWAMCTNCCREPWPPSLLASSTAAVVSECELATPAKEVICPDVRFCRLIALPRWRMVICGNRP